MKTVVSGSFKRHLGQMAYEIAELKKLGISVLSPSSLNVIDRQGDFLFVEGDAVRSIKAVQDAHNKAISSADFLWVVAPDGYIGVSAALEMGIAIKCGIPIYSLSHITDTTLREYIQTIPNMEHLVRR